MTESASDFSITVVTPVYNCVDTLDQLHTRLVATLGTLPEIREFEIIYIDDGSTDGGWDVLERICGEEPSARAIRLTRNFGQHHALTAGLDAATGDWVVVLDADLQDPPEAISALWFEARRGFDIVDARRIVRSQSLWRRTGARVFHFWFEWLSGLEYDRRVANFRILNRDVVAAYRLMTETSRNLGAQLQWLGYSRGTIDVEQARRDGRSTYTLSSLVRLAFDTAFAYSNKPLRLAVALGSAIAGIAGCASLVVVARALVWEIPVEGWASLMVSIWFLGGAIIASIGMVGVYVGRAYDEAKGRPLYVVRKRLNFSSEARPPKRTSD